MRRGDISLILGVALLGAVAYWLYKSQAFVNTLRGPVSSRLPSGILNALNTPVATIVDDLTGRTIPAPVQSAQSIGAQLDSFAQSFPFAGTNWGSLQSLIPPLTAAQPPISS